MKLPVLCYYTDFGRLFQLERDENTALRHLVDIIESLWGILGIASRVRL